MVKVPIHWEEYQWRSNPVRTEVPKYFLELRKAHQNDQPLTLLAEVDQGLSGRRSDRGPRDPTSAANRSHKLLKVQTPRLNRADSSFSIANSTFSQNSSPRDPKLHINEVKGVAEQKSTRSPRNIAAERAVMDRLCKAQKLPFYATEEYKRTHYNPALRPSTLEYSGFLPLLQGCTSASPSVQRDVTDAVIALSVRGDENKSSFCQAGAVEELLRLTDSPDLRVRCNAAQSLANLLTHEPNRAALFAIPDAVGRFAALSCAKVVPGTRVQPGGVLVMRAATLAMAQLANSQTVENKRRFMDTGLIRPICRLTRSEDKATRMAAARGVLWLCQSPGNSRDKWHRSQDVTPLGWTTEQLSEAVRAAASPDAQVTTQILLGFRCICTAVNSGNMLARTEILAILSSSLRGELFQDNFPLLMAALGLVAVLAEFPWPSDMLDAGLHAPLLSNLLSLLPRTELEVKCMQSAKGVMSTWSDKTLAEQSAFLASHPECSMSEVGEIFPESFRQLQCYVLVEEVLEVMDKLMGRMTLFREGLFHKGAAQHFINIHLHSKYSRLQARCLRLLVLMAGSPRLAGAIGSNHKYMDIIHFALCQTADHSLLKACMASVRELSRDPESLDRFVERGLVQALGRHVRSNDPTLQINLLGSFANLAKSRAAKDQIASLPQWASVVRFADSFEPQVRSQASALFTEMATGNDSPACRRALSLLVQQLNYLLRASRISEVVAQTVMDFVNQIARVVLVQSWVRRFLARRRIRHRRRNSVLAGHKAVNIANHSESLNRTIAFLCSPPALRPAPPPAPAPVAPPHGGRHAHAAGAGRASPGPAHPPPPPGRASVSPGRGPSPASPGRLRSVSESRTSPRRSSSFRTDSDAEQAAAADTATAAAAAAAML